MWHIDSICGEYETLLLKTEAQWIADSMIESDWIWVEKVSEPDCSGSKEHPSPVTTWRICYLLDCIDIWHPSLDLGVVTVGDSVFAALSRVRIFQPGSKLGAIEMFTEV